MLPDFIVIGSQKCGTTSLYYYLSQHPEIAMSHTKELNFFIESANWKRGLPWYQSQFSGAKFRRALVRGEISPCYTACGKFPGVAPRMHSIVPDAKLIYLVGDPVHRVISQYMHMYSRGWENRDFHTTMEDALENPRSPGAEYLNRSCYFLQLSQFLPYYDLANILIVPREDLLQNRLQALQQIFQFLGVNENFTSSKFTRVKHQTEQRRRKTAFGQRLENLTIAKRARQLPYDLYWRAERHLYYGFSKPISRPIVEDELREKLKNA